VALIDRVVDQPAANAALTAEIRDPVEALTTSIFDRHQRLMDLSTTSGCAVTREAAVAGRAERIST
jgi:hypothetical protein